MVAAVRHRHVVGVRSSSSGLVLISALIARWSRFLVAQLGQEFSATADEYERPFEDRLGGVATMPRNTSLGVQCGNAVRSTLVW